MPLEDRYKPVDIRSVLNASKLKKGKDIQQGYYNDISVPGFYTPTNENTCVFTVASDKENSTNANPIHGLIQKVMESANDKKWSEVQTILIPVIEEQKIFGIIPRNHWVTLHYDTKTNCATLLDSRPWYVSIFYPISSMKNSLKKGIEHLFGKDKADKMTFKSCYQGVQFNDTHCGAWTSRNVLDLAVGSTIDQQKIKYNASEEMDIVKANFSLVNPDKKMDSPKKQSFFQWIVSLFFRKNPDIQQNIKEEKSNNTNIPTSNVQPYFDKKQRNSSKDFDDEFKDLYENDMNPNKNVESHESNDEINNTLSINSFRG